jgi:archaellum component FlaC
MSSSLARGPLVASIVTVTLASASYLLPQFTSTLDVAGANLVDYAPLVALALAGLTIVLLGVALLMGGSKRNKERAEAEAPVAGSEWGAPSATTPSDAPDAHPSFEELTGLPHPGDSVAVEPYSNEFDIPAAKLTSAEKREAKRQILAEKKRAAAEAKFQKAAEKEAAKIARKAARAAKRGKGPVDTDILEDETGTGWARNYDETLTTESGSGDPDWLTSTYSDPTFSVPFETDKWKSAADAAQERIETMAGILRELLTEAQANADAVQAAFDSRLTAAISSGVEAQRVLTDQIEALRERGVWLHSQLDEMRERLTRTESEVEDVERRAHEAENQLVIARDQFEASVTAIAEDVHANVVSRLDRLRDVAAARADLDDVLVEVIAQSGDSMRQEATSIDRAFEQDAPLPTRKSRRRAK